MVVYFFASLWKVMSGGLMEVFVEFSTFTSRVCQGIPWNDLQEQFGPHVNLFRWVALGGLVWCGHVLGLGWRRPDRADATIFDLVLFHGFGSVFLRSTGWVYLSVVLFGGGHCFNPLGRITTEYSWSGCSICLLEKTMTYQYTIEGKEK
jgi:hypothetical protein